MIIFDVFIIRMDVGFLSQLCLYISFPVTFKLHLYIGRPRYNIFMFVGERICSWLIFKRIFLYIQWGAMIFRIGVLMFIGAFHLWSLTLLNPHTAIRMLPISSPYPTKTGVHLISIKQNCRLRFQYFFSGILFTLTIKQSKNMFVATQRYLLHIKHAQKFGNQAWTKVDFKVSGCLLLLTPTWSFWKTFTNLSWAWLDFGEVCKWSYTCYRNRSTSANPGSFFCIRIGSSFRSPFLHLSIGWTVGWSGWITQGCGRVLPSPALSSPLSGALTSAVPNQAEDYKTAHSTLPNVMIFSLSYNHGEKSY